MNLIQRLATHIASSHSSVPQPPFIVTICGWADTGKSTLARSLCAALGSINIGSDVLSTDAFLKKRDERNALGLTGYNALSIDTSAMNDTIASIVNRQNHTYCPYDNRTGCKTTHPTTLYAHAVIVIEGIHAFHPVIFKVQHYGVFIDSDASTLRVMRARANVHKRGMNARDSEARIEKELADYRAFTLPLKSHADVVVKVSAEFEYSVQP